MTIKLDKSSVGKCYVDQKGVVRKILAYNYYSYNEERYKFVTMVYDPKRNQVSLSFEEGWQNVNEDGRSPAGAVNLVKEYKEPVVHKKDFIWYKDQYGEVLYVVKEIGQLLVDGRNKELKRQTVEYIEEE